MERRNFIKTCTLTSVGIAVSLQGCSSAYYATVIREDNTLRVARNEFLQIKGDKTLERNFVMLRTPNVRYPICLYKVNDDEYVAALMMCTHNQCELNTGGDRYTCPCHGSEFSIQGEVLEGPAERDLTLFKTEISENEIRVHLV